MKCVQILLIFSCDVGAALKKLETDKGIVIRYVIGRRFVSVFLLVFVFLWKKKIVGECPFEIFPSICSTEFL